MVIIILILMLFAHIVDDYYLQGVLVKLKQKKFWEENASDKKYRYDYIVALIMHSLSWATMIILPIIWLQYSFIVDLISGIYIAVVVMVNLIIHAIVDDLKANKLKINLVVDQSIHLIQIIITWILFMFIL